MSSFLAANGNKRSASFGQSNYTAKRLYSSARGRGAAAHPGSSTRCNRLRWRRYKRARRGHHTAARCHCETLSGYVAIWGTKPRVRCATLGWGI